MTPVIATLPSQQKLVLAAILLNEQHGLRNVQTGKCMTSTARLASTFGKTR